MATRKGKCPEEGCTGHVGRTGSKDEIRLKCNKCGTETVLKEAE